jgi:uncharacterized protein YajQ (UPF0234 family)
MRLLACGVKVMPSFDIVSEVELHELTNAVDQSNRLISNRFDFKGVDASFERNDRQVTLTAEGDFQLQQMVDILRSALMKCKIDPAAMDVGQWATSGKGVKQVVTLKHGLDKDVAKKVAKMIKDEKFKVQASIQGETVRVTGKKRDDLQEVMGFLRGADIGQPVQFNNFRD